MSFIYRIGWRYVFSVRHDTSLSLISLLSIIGISLGVATLIVVMAVMNGFHIELRNRILGLHGHIYITAPNVSLEMFDQLATQIRAENSVKTTIPLIERQVMVTSKEIAHGALVKAFRPEDIMQKKLIADNIIAGSLDALSSDYTLIIGNGLAQLLHLTLGDSITLVSPKGNASALGMIPRLKTFKIVGIFHVGMYEYDSNILLMNLKTAQIFFKHKDRVDGLEIMINDPDNASLVRRHIKDALLSTQDEVPYFITDWTIVNGGYFDALKVERTVMFALLLLIIAVASFNIISVLTMLVKDKIKSIAILRTLGVTSREIISIFTFCGFILGSMGTVIGCILGVSTASNIESIRQGLSHLTGTTLFDPVIYFLSTLPSVIDPKDVIYIIVASCGFSIVFPLVAARKAARYLPSEGLRYE